MTQQKGKSKMSSKTVNTIGSIIMMLILFVPNSIIIYTSDSPRKMIIIIFLGGISIFIGLFLRYIIIKSDERHVVEYEERKKALINIFEIRDQFIISHMLASLVMTSENPDVFAEKLWQAYKDAYTAWEKGEFIVTIDDSTISFGDDELPQQSTDPRNN
jgi:hypothetical protein